MNTRSTALLFALVLAGLAGCETPPYHGDVRVHDRDYDVRIVFSDRDRVVLRDYYRDYYRLPPGLAKKGKIPPGHAFKLRRHEGLPPGAAWEYLPPELERRLSPLPNGYIHVAVDGSVGILHTRTRVVLDVVDLPRD